MYRENENIFWTFTNECYALILMINDQSSSTYYNY